MGLVLEGSAQLLDGHVSVQDGIVARAADESTTVGITRRAPDQPQFLLLMEIAERVYTN